MIALHPPDDPFLINTSVFGFPFQVRWYGVLIVTGALIGGWLATRRASRRGENPEHVWNLLVLGMLLGVIGARAYYVVFEWQRFAQKSLIEIINPATGGLAIHGALIGAAIAAVIYTRRHHLSLLRWLDICMPGFLLAQAVGRWGNFFNQEAYGRPTTLGFGVSIDPEHRLPPYDDLNRYPPHTLFHATFLYESTWNLAGVGVILWLERRFRGWLHAGDVALMYAIWYGLGRFWIEGLRTDSLYAGDLRAAQVVSLLLVAGGLVGFLINHKRSAAMIEEPAAAVETEPPPAAPSGTEAPISSHRGGA